MYIIKCHDVDTHTQHKNTQQSLDGVRFRTAALGVPLKTFDERNVVCPTCPNESIPITLSSLHHYIGHIPVARMFQQRHVTKLGAHRSDYCQHRSSITSPLSSYILTQHNAVPRIFPEQFQTELTTQF